MSKVITAFLAASAGAALLCGAAGASVRACSPEELNSSAPAPGASNGTAAKQFPSAAPKVSPESVSFLATINEAGTASAVCVNGADSDPELVARGLEILPRLVFKTPVAPTQNYLIRLVGQNSFGWVQPPPGRPTIGGCAAGQAVEPAERKPEPELKVFPKYPTGAAWEGVTGTVVVAAQIGADGRGKALCIVSATAPGWFGKEAEAAANELKFKPGTFEAGDIYLLNAEFKPAQ